MNQVLDPPTAAPLAGLRVVELSVGISGAYCTKTLADAGAEVVKVEPPAGDPLRRRALTTAELDPHLGGALFQYLATSKRSVVVRPDASEDRALAERLVAEADAVVWSRGTELAERLLTPGRVQELAPRAVVAAITPFGLVGPWADHPWTPATLEAWSGAAGQRGCPSRPPVLAGFEPAEWVGGMFASLGILTSLLRPDGDLLDVSLLESLILAGSPMYPATFYSMAGYPWRAVRAQNLPDVHPTKDGYVGFMVVTGQQWTDFCVLIGQPEWTEDPSLFYFHHRNLRREELVGVINEWTSSQTTAEITELASLFRVPAAPVSSGATVAELEQVVERGFVVPEPRGRFLQPDVPFRLGSARRWRPFAPSPGLGADTERVRTEPPDRPRFARGARDHTQLPFDGMRVADFTAYWAGPIIGNFLGSMGADVIHIESWKRPDGMRFGPIRTPGEPDWWEWSPLFQGPNTNKRALTLDLDTPRGMELVRDLIRRCDVLVENFSPRVVENWGLDYVSVRELRPDIIMLRVPAYGVTGPWRNWGGYAQTIEDASGMTFLNGYPDAEPQVLNGICDPVGGMHAAIGLLAAVHDRRRTGAGASIEAPMLTAALNIAAEPILEHSAYGNLVCRTGNAGLLAAPQGVYRSADPEDRWVVISVTDAGQWDRLAVAIGAESLLGDPRFATPQGRRAAQADLDEVLGAWVASRDAQDGVDTLLAADVPAAVVLMPHEQPTIPQLVDRAFFEEVEHPLIGPILHSGFPTRFASRTEPYNRWHAPLLGQHNGEILAEVLGLAAGEIEELEAAGVIADRPLEPDVAWGV